MPAGNTSTTHRTNLSTGHAKGASTLFRHLPGKHLVGAMLLGLALRLFFVIHFPFYAGDTKFYDELARNWLDHGVYGLFVHGQLVSVDMRMPGYPAFLAGVYAVFGRTTRAVMLSQAVIDLILVRLDRHYCGAHRACSKQDSCGNYCLVDSRTLSPYGKL